MRCTAFAFLGTSPQGNIRIGNILGGSRKATVEQQVLSASKIPAKEGSDLHPDSDGNVTTPMDVNVFTTRSGSCNPSVASQAARSNLAGAAMSCCDPEAVVKQSPIKLRESAPSMSQQLSDDE